jgi:hypothetical protein
MTLIVIFNFKIITKSYESNPLFIKFLGKFCSNFFNSDHTLVPKNSFALFLIKVSEYFDLLREKCFL